MLHFQIKINHIVLFIKEHKQYSIKFVFAKLKFRVVMKSEGNLKQESSN